jgi:hypothetical protein
MVFNLSRPRKSLMLLAPLTEDAGGYGLCRKKSGKPAKVFESADDPAYRDILGMVRRGKQYLQKNKRFDMEGFRPRHAYIREMQRYGVLPENVGADEPLDPYALDREYWRSLWYKPTDTRTAQGEGRKPAR